MSDEVQDQQTVGGSRALRDFLAELQATGSISKLVDGYRLCIATACAYQRAPDLDKAYANRNTMFSPTTLDTGDFAIRTAIGEIYPEHADVPYRCAESLAEQGVEILKGMMVGDDLSYSDLLDRVDRAAQEDANS